MAAGTDVRRAHAKINPEEIEVRRLFERGSTAVTSARDGQSMRCCGPLTGADSKADD